MFGAISTATAQEERPQIPLGERRPTQKKDNGPRALALLRFSENGKASIEPIAILIDGKFWDASAYKADPVPMALDPGTIYEAERSGASLGLFTINSALHSNGTGNQPPWIATGAWRPTGTEPTGPAIVAESAPVGIGTDDAPPRLTHDVSKASVPPTPPPTGSKPSSAPPSKPAGSSNSDEPPRLSKPSSSTSTTDSPPDGGGEKGNSSAAQDKSKPSIKEDKSSGPASDSGTDESGRPRLRRGRPAESFADVDEVVPGYSKPGRSNATSSNDGKVAEAAVSGDVKLIPAISDAHGPNPHTYAFEWLKGEEGDRRKQMMDLAKQQVQAYVTAQAKARIAPKPAHPTATRNSATAIKTKEPIFENVQMIAYDLWNSNQAVIILSANAHMPAAGSVQSNPSSDLQYSVLLVAYPDIYNNLHKLYSGVTDKYHLDITPKLDLIDAVDADGDGTGELLFRETSDAGSGWAICRATADKLYKMYDSFNPE